MMTLQSIAFIMLSMKTDTRLAILEAIKKQTDANTKSKTVARSALRRMGIVDRKGNIAKEYTRDPRSEGMMLASPPTTTSCSAISTASKVSLFRRHRQTKPTFSY